MANVFVSLPVPAGDGVGAWVDVSGLGPEKTVSVDGGSFGGQILLEASNDAQASAAPAAVGPFPGPTFVPQTFVQALQYMRVRRTGSNGVGTPTVSIAGPAASANVFGAMNVPTSDGVGTAIDLSGGGDVNTFQVEGPFSGQLLIETSTDGVNFSPTLLFSVFHGVGQTVLGVLSAARVRRRGTTTAALPLISVGSGATQGGGGGGGFPGYGGAPPAVAIASAAGVSAVASRSDHTHAAVVLNIAPGAGVTATNVGGTWTIAATAVTFPGYGGAPPAVTTVGSSAGTATSVSRSDHTHAGVASIIAGSNVTIADDGAGNITVNSTGGGGGFPGFGGAPPAVATASAAGASGLASRSDHTHAATVLNLSPGTGITTTNVAGTWTIASTVTGFPGYGGAPPAVTTVGSSAGTATTVSRSDHTHSGVHTIVAGTLITIADDGAGNVTVNTTATTFPGFGGAPPKVASASAAGTATTASHSDHTHGLDIVAYTPSLAGLQASGVLQQTFSAGTATPSLYAAAATRVPFGAATAGTLTDSASFTYSTSTGFRAGAVPYVTFDSGAPTASTNGTTFRHRMTPPATARTAAQLDAVLFDAVTVTLTGGAGSVTANSYFRVAGPTFNSSGGVMNGTLNTVEIDGPIYGTNMSPFANSPVGFALLLNDNLAQGTGNLGLSDGAIFVQRIVGWGNGAANLEIALQTGNQIDFFYNVAGDGSGGTSGGNMNALGWTFSLPTTVSAAFVAGTLGLEAVTVAPNGAGSDVALGITGGVATGATHGFPYMVTCAGNPTAATTAFGAGMSAFVWDSTNRRLNVQSGGAWNGIPSTTPTAAGAGVALLNSAPGAIVSLTAKWEFYKDAAGVSSYRPFYQ